MLSVIKISNILKNYKKILLFSLIFFLVISIGFLIGNHFSWEGKKGFYWDGPKTFNTYMKKKYYVQKPVNPLDLNSENIEIKNFIRECESSNSEKDKFGFNTDIKVEHPITKKPIPVYIANFVLMDYGLGAIFGCPAHDQRDLDFALEYKLDVIPVVMPKTSDEKGFEVKKEAFVEDGIVINSDFLNGLSLSLIHI